MSRSGRPTDDKPLPPLYAMTHGGIESTAADEITRDIGGEVKIRDLKKAGVAVLLSSHLLDRVQSVCDRVALFNKGKIALMGTVVELANQVLGAGHPLLVEASGVDVASTLKSIEGVQQVVDTGQGAWRVVADRDVRAAAAQHIIAAGGSLTRLAELQPSLEEVYTRYFQEQRHAA